MQIECPKCGCKNQVERINVLTCYTLEYRCKCGYILIVTDWMESKAFKTFTDEIFKDRQAKLVPKCSGCGN